MPIQFGGVDPAAFSTNAGLANAISGAADGFFNAQTAAMQRPLQNAAAQEALLGGRLQNEQARLNLRNQASPFPGLRIASDKDTATAPNYPGIAGPAGPGSDPMGVINAAVQGIPGQLPALPTLPPR